MDIKTLDAGYAGQGSAGISSAVTQTAQPSETNKNPDTGIENINTSAVPIADAAASAKTSDSSIDPNKDDDEKKKQASQKQIEDAVSDINKHAYGTEAVFGIHDKTNRVTIKIVDKQTRKVIKEYPPEKTLDLIAKVWEMAGILVDEKR